MSNRERAMAESIADERVRRALDEENAVWQSAETRMNAIVQRYLLGRYRQKVSRVWRDPGLSWGGALGDTVQPHWPTYELP
jgi:hypothetical protein